MTNGMLQSFLYAYGEPSCAANFRSQLSDFVVVEELGFETSGSGEHLYCSIKKRGENTSWIAEKLAQFFDLKTVDVGYSGMKDRFAETTQWFSVYLPGQSETPDWQLFKDRFALDIDVLQTTRHSHKLRRGMHQHNYFQITLRDLSDVVEASSRLNQIAQKGVPNYFGEQRFGREASNLASAKSWFEQGRVIRKRNTRSIVLSAARSYLFNLVLSHRVLEGNWSALIEGDDAIEEKPSGPLWGRGRSSASGHALETESLVLEPYRTWCHQLEHVGLKHERRTFALMPIDFNWDTDQRDLKLNFSLSKGQFATSVLREVCQLSKLAGK